MDKRSLFYWSREYAKGLNAGQDYDELPNVIAINIVNFDFLDCGNYHSCFHLWEDTEKSFIRKVWFNTPPQICALALFALPTKIWY
jgi:predicted transposase/invertase (TIGR01784 family)